MQNLAPAFFRAIEFVCIDWNANRCAHWGFSLDAKRKSIARAYKFTEDLFTDNPAMVPEPGPFKVAAVFLVSGMKFIEFEYFPLKDVGRKMDEVEKRDWNNRLMVRAVTALLPQLKLSSTGNKLTKHWQTPSAHYRLDLLNFLRWTEFPESSSSNPQEIQPSIDFVRLNRLIMAVTLIIESCYYLSGNEVRCDVLNNLEMKIESLDDACKRDLFFDTIPPWAKGNA
jgi:hypothetical protein